MLRLPGIRIYTVREINEMHNVLTLNIIRARIEIENSKEESVESPDWYREILRRVSAKLH